MGPLALILVRLSSIVSENFNTVSENKTSGFHGPGTVSTVRNGFCALWCAFLIRVRLLGSASPRTAFHVPNAASAFKWPGEEAL